MIDAAAAPRPRGYRCGVESVWDYPRPPRLETNTRHLLVRHAGAVVADSRGGWRVLETSHPPVYYIPPEDITHELLRPGLARSLCEFKGWAGYWDLVADGGVEVSEVGWSYPEPAPGYEPIADAVAFYASRVDECSVDGERVQPQPGDFYGGWITTGIVGPFKGAPGTRGW
jgi:uncharacterized protein (DUF427 family)